MATGFAAFGMAMGITFAKAPQGAPGAREGRAI